jgi:hypothetical protein
MMVEKFTFEKAAIVWNLSGLSLEERQQLLPATGWTFTELMFEHMKRQDALCEADEKRSLKNKKTSRHK